MRNLLLATCVLIALALVASPASSQGKMALSVGGDVLLPMGTFKDAVSTGFGGSVRFQYEVAPNAAVGATTGYYTWGGKDLGGNLGTGPSFKGVPFRVFGKYYFMPAGEKQPRVYGIAELGLFFGSSGDVTIPGVNVPGVGVVGGGTVSGGSSTNFNYAPGLGVEVPLGEGKTLLDISARYDGIATSGGSSSSVAARVGVNFPLGQ